MNEITTKPPYVRFLGSISNILDCSKASPWGLFLIITRIETTPDKLKKFFLQTFYRSYTSVSFQDSRPIWKYKWPITFYGIYRKLKKLFQATIDIKVHTYALSQRNTSVFNDTLKRCHTIIMGDKKFMIFSIEDNNTCPSFIKVEEKEKATSLWKASIMELIIVLAVLGLVSTHPQEQSRGRQIFLCLLLNFNIGI